MVGRSIILPMHTVVLNVKNNSRVGGLFLVTLPALHNSYLDSWTKPLVAAGLQTWQIIVKLC